MSKLDSCRAALPANRLPEIKTAFYLSVVSTLSALAVFGFVKGRFTGVPGIRSALQTVLVGGLAAAAAYSLARLIA
jgi:VIT1/CCC1 family predicted Fe2+/Mn2+ transporter